MNTLNTHLDIESRQARPAAPRSAGVKRFGYGATLAFALVSATAGMDTAHAGPVAKAPAHSYSVVAIGIGTLWYWLFGGR